VDERRSSRCRPEQLVELGNPTVELEQLRAALVHEVLAKAILPVHLEHQPAQVANPLLAVAEQPAPLPPELSGRGEGAPHGRRQSALGLSALGLSALGRLLGRRFLGASRQESGPRHAPRVYVRGLLEAVLGSCAPSESCDEEPGQDQADDADRDPDPRHDEQEDDPEDDECECDADHTVRVPTRVRVETTAG
jgi:hypothetical protein